MVLFLKYLFAITDELWFWELEFKLTIGFMKFEVFKHSLSSKYQIIMMLSAYIFWAQTLLYFIFMYMPAIQKFPEVLCVYRYFL